MSDITYKGTFPDAWQAQFVSAFEADVDKITSIAKTAPLVVTRSGVPYNCYAMFPGESGFQVTTPYLEIKYSLPSTVTENAVDLFTFEGHITIVKRQYSYCRDYADIAAGTAMVVAERDHTALYAAHVPVTNITRDVYLPAGQPTATSLVDQVVGNGGTTWYYTIFYKNSVTDQWAYSPAYCLSKNWPYKMYSRLDTNGDTVPYSPHGDFMYGKIPSGFRKDDGTATVPYAVRNMFLVFGRTLDMFKEEQEHNRRVYDIDNIDSSLIPYVDWLLGWPTNFELPEDYRRRETKLATELWKTRGTNDALITILEEVTNWRVRIYEGWLWSLTSYDVVGEVGTNGVVYYDPANEPADWVTATDGNWINLCNVLPQPISFDETNIPMLFNGGTVQDKRCYSFSDEHLSEHGLGWSWQNPNGYLIGLEEIPGNKSVMLSTVLEKVNTLAKTFLPHFASFDVAVDEFTSGEGIGSGYLVFRFNLSGPIDTYPDFPDLLETYLLPDEVDTLVITNVSLTATDSGDGGDLVGGASVDAVSIFTMPADGPTVTPPDTSAIAAPTAFAEWVADEKLNAQLTSTGANADSIEVSVVAQYQPDAANTIRASFADASVLNGVLSVIDLPFTFPKRFVALSQCKLECIKAFRTTPGSSGSTVIDFQINGVSIFSDPADKPTFLFSDASSVVEATTFGALAPIITMGSILDVVIESTEVDAEDLFITYRFSDMLSPDRYLTALAFPIEGHASELAVPVTVDAGFKCFRAGKITRIGAVKSGFSVSDVGVTHADIYVDGVFTTSIDLSGTLERTITVLGTPVAILINSVITVIVTAFSDEPVDDLTVWIYLDDPA